MSNGTHSEGRLFYEDLRVGYRFSGTARWTVSEAEIKAFAAQFDPQPFHLNADAGRETVFGGLVASGWHTAALMMRLILEGGPAMAGGTVGLGADLSWLKAVRPGDTLSVGGEVVEAIPSRTRTDRGRIVMRIETRNQSGEVVQTCLSRLLVPRRQVGDHAA